MDVVVTLVMLIILGFIIYKFLSDIYQSEPTDPATYTVGDDTEAKALISFGWVEVEPVGLYHPQTGAYYTPDGKYHNELSFIKWLQDHDLYR